MRHPAFKSDWNVVDIRDAVVADTLLPSLQLPSTDRPSDCIKCTENWKTYQEHIEILGEVKDILRKILSINVHARPAARSLRDVWQKWEV